MVAFLFMNLPLLASKNVMQTMKNMDILNFALVSIKSRNYAKLSQRRIRVIRVKLHDSSWCNITVFLPENEDHVNIYWDFLNEKKVLNQAPGKSDKFSLGEIEIESTRAQIGKVTSVYSYCLDQLSAAFNVVNVLFDVFNPQELNFTILRESTPDITKFIKWEVLNKVKSLRYICNSLTNDEFDSLHQFLKTKESLNVNFANYVNKDHGHSDILKHDVLSIGKAMWFTKESIDLLGCKVLYAKITGLVPEDLNYLLKKWINDYSFVLEKAEIQLHGGTFAEILDGIEVKSLRSLKMERNMQMQSLKFHHGENFTRHIFGEGEGKHILRADGKIASVHLKRNVFYFQVWTDNNPVVTNLVNGNL